MIEDEWRNEDGAVTSGSSVGRRSVKDRKT